jgi:hypothetical protein
MFISKPREILEVWPIAGKGEPFQEGFFSFWWTLVSIFGSKFAITSTESTPGVDRWGRIRGRWASKGEIFQDLVVAFLISAIRRSRAVQVRFFGTWLNGAWSQQVEGKYLEWLDIFARRTKGEGFRGLAGAADWPRVLGQWWEFSGVKSGCFADSAAASPVFSGMQGWQRWEFSGPTDTRPDLCAYYDGHCWASPFDVAVPGAAW